MKELIKLWKESNLEDKLLYLYTALIPFLDTPLFIFANKKIIFADFVFIFLFMLCIVRYLRGTLKIKQSPLLIPLFLMLATFSISIINSINIFSSFAELISLIYLIVLFFSIIIIVSNKDKLKLMLYIYLSVSFVISLPGLVLLIVALLTKNVKTTSFLGYGTMESMAHHFPRLDMTFESANMLLAYLHVALIVAVILFLFENKRKIRFLIGATIPIILVAAFFTGSRRFTGLLLSIFLLLVWYGKAKFAVTLKYISFLVFIIFFVVAFLTTIWVVFPVRIDKDNVNKTLTLSAKYSYSIHYLLPTISLNMFKKHPIIGVGFGTFNKNFKDYVDWDWYKSSFGFEAYPSYVKKAENKTLNLDPHSLIFGTLAETGIVGLLGLFYFFFRYTGMLIKRRSKSIGFEEILSGCVLAGLIGFLFNSITLDILSMRHFWFMLAIGVAGSTSHLWIESKKKA